MRYCHNSAMALYSNVNYEGTPELIHVGAYCHNFNSSTYKSIRFF
ncbi:unnamed protein product, partial [Allacma fusca]